MVARSAKQSGRPARERTARSPAKKTSRTARTSRSGKATSTGNVTAKTRITRKPDRPAKARAGSVKKITNKQPRRKPEPRKRRKVGGRIAAPKARLGMTPQEVRDCSGRPECILFGSSDHVEWQFGQKGLDVTGSPTLYVTTLTFSAGKVVRVTEKMAEVT